jgi:hypothetical protein
MKQNAKNKKDFEAARLSVFAITEPVVSSVERSAPHSFELRNPVQKNQLPHRPAGQCSSSQIKRSPENYQKTVLQGKSYETPTIK